MSPPACSLALLSPWSAAIGSRASLPAPPLRALRRRPATPRLTPPKCHAPLDGASPFYRHSERSRKAMSIYETQNLSFEVELCPLGKNPVTFLLLFPTDIAPFLAVWGASST